VALRIEGNNFWRLARIQQDLCCEPEEKFMEI
jgi:hypothetical protein